MPITTFTSDYGSRDFYVAAVKAAIMGASPEHQVVDISHHIDAHDISQGAYIISRVYRDFPEGSVHLIAVSTVSFKKVHLLARMNGHYFICPDNGILSLIDGTPEQVISLKEHHGNFPGRDLYAPVVVRLMQGEKMEQLGDVTGQWDQLLNREPRCTRSGISGQVVYVDGYGNLHTNIRKTDFDTLLFPHNAYSGGQPFPDQN
jgi:hypothetical protein